VINNAGTFRKSSGSGISRVSSNGPGAEFNNTGTVEVTSGNLWIFRGTNRDGQFVFANGGRVRLLDRFDLYGTTTASGDGVLEIGDYATVQAAAGETATISNFTDGARLLVRGGQIGADAAGTLKLDLTGQGKVDMMGGHIAGAGATVNVGNFDWSGGTITGSGGLLNTSSTFRVIGYGGISGGGVLTNSGTVTVLGNAGVGLASDGATVNNLAGALWDFQGDNNALCGDSTAGPRVINNAGTFRKSSGSGISRVSSNGPGAEFNNTGTVEVTSGTLAFNGPFTQTAGLTSLNGGSITSTSSFNILGGSVTGTGEIVGDILNQGGILTPGFSPGTLTIDGDYTQGPDGRLLMEIAGFGAGEFDVLNITGTAYLDGLLEITLLNGFLPTTDYTFDFLNCGSCVGTFDQVIGWDLGSGNYFALNYLASGPRLDFHSGPQAIPAPSAHLLATLGCVSLLFFKRLRRR
jgi:hypothetical protein